MSQNTLSWECRKLLKSKLFNQKYYLQHYPDVSADNINPAEHYLTVGWTKGYNPSQKFNTNVYLMLNPDVKQAGMNPLLHYLMHGQAEGRFAPPVTDISLPVVESGTILLLSHELSLTGAPIALLNTARALQRHKKKCLILSPVGGKLEQECKKYGVQCLVYPKLLIHLSRQDAQTQRFFKQFDTVLLNTIVMAKYARFIKPLVRRVVLWVHEGAFGYENETRNSDLKSDFSYVDTIYSVGNYSKSFTDKYSGKCSQILLYGIDEVKIPTAQKRSNKLVFGIFSTCDTRKAQDKFIQAVKKIPQNIRDNCEFNIVGKLQDDKYCKFLKKLAINTPVRFLGELSHPETLREMARTDVICCTSLDDPMPIVCTEAMMLHKPVICSDKTGTAAFIQDGKNSFLYKTDTDNLADIMIRVYKQRSDLHRIGNRWNAVYQKNFTPKIFEQNILSVLFREKCTIVMNNMESKDVPYYQMMSEKFQKYVSNNTGNILIPTYGARNLDYDFEYLAPFDMKNDSDSYIIFAANVLRNNVQLNYEKWFEFLGRCKKPINIMGLGAQTTLEEMNPRKYANGLSSEMVRWIQMIADRCNVVGVRGEFTADVLKSLGIKNVDAVGCPTYFVNGYAQPQIIKKNLSELRNVVFHTCWEPYSDWHVQWNRAVLDNMLQFSNPAFVIQSEFKFLPYLIANTDQLQSLMALQNSDISASVDAICRHFGLDENDVVTNDKIRHLFHIFSDMNKWAEFIKSYDVAFGFRIHGNIIALKNGVPAINIATDSRVYEMCELFKIPYVRVNQFDSTELNFNKIYEQADFSEMNKQYPVLLQNFINFLDKNNIKHLYN